MPWGTGPGWAQMTIKVPGYSRLHVPKKEDNWQKQKGLNLTTSKECWSEVLLCEKWLMLCTLIAKRNAVFLRHLCKGGIIPKSGAHVT